MQVSAIFPRFIIYNGKLTPVQKHCVMIILVTEDSKPTEILRQLLCVFGEQLAISSVFNGVNTFMKVKSIEDDLHKGQPKGVISEAIHCIEQKCRN